ncbi:hypothetical protein HID58_002392 [Brassica napus]|uniref:DUF223 domain-containing protein n=1 Tax=Brassica napus TaxID=3708 RepID=A0ABQ8EM43_BRANA|nr:hypothetical protein HID58_002392 [Brassica napus]
MIKSASFVLIEDIDPAKDCYKIKVKVNEDSCFYIDERSLETFLSKLSKGGSFILSNFTIGDHTTEYKLNPLLFKINFYRTTKTTSCDDFPKKLPNNYFKYFKEILEHKYEKEVLIEVIGEVVNVRTLEDLMAKGKSSTKLELTIRDINDTCLPCTLWSRYAKQVSYFFKSIAAACIVCVARFVCVRELRGAVTVSNVFNATEIFFLIHNYKKCLISKLSFLMMI